MIFLFCLCLLLSARGISRAADLVADWCVTVADRWGEPAAWVVLFACLLAYVSPTLIAAYFTYLDL